MSAAKLSDAQVLETGKVYYTRGIADAMDENVMLRFLVIGALERHRRGDWGELTPHDQAENQLALEHDYRIISSYHTDMVEDGKIWIITESGRETTTVLLPSEY